MRCRWNRTWSSSSTRADRTGAGRKARLPEHSGGWRAIAVPFFVVGPHRPPRRMARCRRPTLPVIPDKQRKRRRSGIHCRAHRPPMDSGSSLRSPGMTAKRIKRVQAHVSPQHRLPIASTPNLQEFAIVSPVLRLLTWLGLLEGGREAEVRLALDEYLRKAPLFGQLMSLEVEMKGAEGLRH